MSRPHSSSASVNANATAVEALVAAARTSAGNAAEENSVESSVSFQVEELKKEDTGKFVATMTGTLPTLSGEDPKSEAEKLLQYGVRPGP
eukprot:3561325-Rhodomonas_salina.1